MSWLQVDQAGKGKLSWNGSCEGIAVGEPVLEQPESPDLCRDGAGEGILIDVEAGEIGPLSDPGGQSSGELIVAEIPGNPKVKNGEPREKKEKERKGQGRGKSHKTLRLVMFDHSLGRVPLRAFRAAERIWRFESLPSSVGKVPVRLHPDKPLESKTTGIRETHRRSMKEKHQNSQKIQTGLA